MMKHNSINPPQGLTSLLGGLMLGLLPGLFTQPVCRAMPPPCAIIQQNLEMGSMPERKRGSVNAQVKATTDSPVGGLATRSLGTAPYGRGGYASQPSRLKPWHLTLGFLACLARIGAATDTLGRQGGEHSLYRLEDGFRSISILQEQGPKAKSASLPTPQPTYPPTHTNHAPRVEEDIPTQQATIGQEFEFVVSHATFSDPDNDTLTLLSPKLVGGDNLPSWLTCITDLWKFKGIPQASDVGIIQVNLTVVDGSGGHASNPFFIRVQEEEVAQQSWWRDPTVIGSGSGGIGLILLGGGWRMVKWIRENYGKGSDEEAQEPDPENQSQPIFQQICIQNQCCHNICCLRNTNVAGDKQELSLQIKAKEDAADVDS